MKKVITKLPIVSLYVLLSSSFAIQTQNATAQLMNDEGLYANGYKNYTQHNWQYATIYLFAFIQRHPQSFQDDPSFEQEVTKAFDHSMQAINKQVSDLQDCRTQVASLTQKNNNGVSSVTQGLGTTPPALRPPSKVKFAAKIY